MQEGVGRRVEQGAGGRRRVQEGAGVVVVIFSSHFRHCSMINDIVSVTRVQSAVYRVTCNNVS